MVENIRFGVPLNGGLLVLLTLGAGAIAMFLAAFFSAQAGLLALAAAWVVAGAWYYPREAFLLLMAVAPFLPILKHTQVVSLVTPLKDVVIATLFTRVVLLPLFRKRDPYRRNTLLLPILAFAAWSVIGALRADVAVLGILRLRDLLLYLPLLWIARACVSTRDDLRTFLRVTFGSLALVLLLAGVQAFAFPDGMVLRFDPSRAQWIPRAAGVLAHPNLLGSYLLLLLPLTWALAVERGMRLRFTAGLLGTAGLIAVFSTYSRSAWITAAVAAVSLAAVFVVRKRAVFRLAVPAIVAVLLLASLLPMTRTLLRTVVDPSYESNRERLDILAGLVAETSNAGALFGSGLGNIVRGTLRDVDISLTDIAAADVQRVQIAKARTFVDNAVLKTWVELGLTGLLLMGWMAWRAVTLAWRGSAHAIPEARAFARGTFAVTVGLAALSFFLDTPEIFPVALYWWTFVGILQALPYLESAHSPA
jgi:O-antigen ligase/polysaccharide polymerase Wzy-like membrane protein